jgi:hypothetical protein
MALALNADNDYVDDAVDDVQACEMLIHSELDIMSRCNI